MYVMFCSTYYNSTSTSTILTRQVWLTVAISADRFYCVRFPMSASSVCTPRRAWLVALALALLSLVFNLPRFALYLPSLHINRCSGRAFFQYKLLLPGLFKVTYAELLDPLICSIVPLLLLVFFNAALIRCLRAATRRRCRMLMHSGADAPNDQSQNGKSRVSNRDNVITLMLIVVVSTFIVLETPSALLNIIDIALKVIDLQKFTANETVMLCSVGFTLLSLINSSIDLFLYTLVNNNFRKDLLETLSFKCSSKNHNTAATTHITHT